MTSPGSDSVDIVFHYPPELISLLIDAIPRLFRSKRDQLLFFKGAGVGARFTGDLKDRVGKDPDSVSRYDIARTVLIRLNERGEATLRERREILRRVVEFEDFSTCWPKEQLQTIGLVAEIRRVINVKDSFTRMAHEQETQSRKHRDEAAARLSEIQHRKKVLEAVKTELFSLFSMTDVWARGKRLESILNRLFQESGILIRDAFTIRGNEAQGIVEQIDGVVEIDGHLRWFLRRMAQVGHPAAVSFCLQNLDALAPALSDVCHYLVGVSSADATVDWSSIGEALLAALSSTLIQSNEYFQLSMLGLFSREARLDHISHVISQFRGASPAIRREIILAAAACGQVDWLRELKEDVPGMDVWTKRAYLYATSLLPADERRFFLRSLPIAGTLEEFIKSWAR